MWRRFRKRRAKHMRYRQDEEEMCMTVTAIAQMAEEEEQPHRGSVIGRQVVYRDRHAGYHRLMLDYFVPKPVYDDKVFRRRFRMPAEMFQDICNALAQHSRHFRLGYNASGQAGFHTLQKVTASVRMLAYGGSADQLDEYIRMGESTIFETLWYFTRYIVEIFGPEFLREPNQHDINRLLAKAEERGFPGMIGSIDCMHWEWAKCPVGSQGEFRGHFKKPTVILEAVTSYDLWIWHAFFGMPGSCNDINVLHRSPVFDKLARGEGPEVNYTVNGRQYDMGYYLADGIYPPWATLISPIPSAQSNKQRKFNQKQQEFRKDVERGFGTIQSQYCILNGLAKMWDPEDLLYIVQCCVILHNMAIKYERGMDPLRDEEYEGSSRVHLDSNRNVPEIQQLIQAHKKIESRAANQQLKNDLVEHVWNQYGSSDE